MRHSPPTNSATRQEIQSLTCLSNEFTLTPADDGRPAEWLRIPYGDHPHSCGVVQRLTQPVAEVMVANFKGIAASLGRFFGGQAIYIGHPDDPTLANQFPDKRAYGWIHDMEARPDGLYVKPKWSSAGLELLANAHFKWFSPYWACKIVPGIRANGRPVVHPVKLESIGLTNSPNIQGIMPLANETQQNTQGVTPAMREQLIQLLGLAPDATDEQIIAAITELKTAQTAADNERAAPSAAETACSNTRATSESEISNLKSQLKAERKARIDLILANAVAAGKITAAQKPQWATDLEQNFDAKLVELANAKPAINTQPQTAGLGARNANAQANRDAQIRRDKVLLLVNERMQKAGEDYETAFAAVRKEHQALFDEMATPGK